MTDISREQRMQAIIIKARRLFVVDALERDTALRANIELWTRKQLSHQQIGEYMYLYVHTLKGVAQTVGCDQVHLLSEAADTYSILHQNDWTEEVIHKLRQFIDQLHTELQRELGNMEAL
ncbi:Hpt domain-containing protein [Paenibacillus sp. 1_12]|uniref:Hpt domain-containing protein n=1 Tax=Paenibacillus sp. 1_12 TaxID=1566278 RepID=UPI0008E3E88F|nr:Hpt domain-containing protein [Paenibacillus sp. 1_12]SFL12149.1 Hpt domain-containing protein [Paenibacillus sp. 1_12]